MTLETSTLQKHKEEKVYIKRRKRTSWLKRRNANKHTVGLKYGTNFEALYPGRIARYLPLTVRQFIKKGYLSINHAKKIITVPSDFSFKGQYDDIIFFFKALISSYLLLKGNLTLDFSKCKSASISAFVQLGILLDEFNAALQRYNKGRVHRNGKYIKIIPSPNIKVLKYLAALNIYVSPKLGELGKSDMFLPLRLQRGRRKGVYSENQKGVVGKRMVDYVNEALRANSYELNRKGQTVFRGLIDEVLSNAEDHSINYSEWFVNGIAFRERQFGTDIVELNFAIVNYGDSMYEGFEKTKELNKANYDLVNTAFLWHQKSLSRKHGFGKEGLFTMLMLNEGISRLKYEESSRGNGTMNFLDAFITIGGFGDDDKKFNSQLNIISGHTCLTCDNNVRPYDSGSMKLISLNRKQDQRLLPDNDYLTDNQEYFPGTILECRIYLNETYFNRKLNL